MNASNHKPPVAGMLTVAIVSLWLLASVWEASAETLYRVSPKIAPRTRESSPVLSPFLTTPAQPAAATSAESAKVQPAPRIEAEPSHDVPVSYTQPQGAMEADPAPATWSGSNRKQDAQPASNSKSSSHPVVHPPEPLLPDSPESILPNLDSPLSGQVEMTAASELEALDQRALVDDNLIAQAATGSSTSSAHSQEKPTVHFPEELTPAPTAAVNTSTQPSSRNIYPVSYQPYIGRITEMRQQELETAISHYNRASYYEQRNKLDEAIAEYKQALLLHSTFADAYVGMSTAQIRKNDWQNVMINLQKALAMKQRFMDPSNIVQAWYNLSTAHCVADQYSPARRYFKKVKLAGHPNTQELWEFIQKNCTP